MSETNTTDNNTYHEVNIDPYPQLQDEDNAGPFDLKSSLFTNANGDAKLTSGGANENNFEVFANWYDFDKKEFTNAGRAFYTKNMEGSSQEEKNAYLTQVENELKSALIADYNKRKKSNPNAKPNPLLGLGGDKPPSGEDDTPQQGIILPEFGHVDHILQTLSLRNLKYPIDADYGNTQDYIQINQFTYKAPQAKLFFGDPDEKTAGGYDPSQITESGVPTGRPTEKALGLVKLPMPNSLADSNNVSWGPDQLNALTAAVSSGVLGQSNQAINDLVNFVNNDFEKGKPL